MNKQSKTDYKRLDAMSDEQALRKAADDPDARPTDAKFWADAEFVEPQAKKVPIHIRLNPDVVKWFKKAGPGYQGRINRVLETYVEHQENSGR
ncbi:MAG: BrnA antitoxin family protein [Thermodesulfobacteriota bacterium]|nr:BrnA antitoxin family protein [Thermodesulfobacteriota bacterium]